MVVRSRDVKSQDSLLVKQQDCYQSLNYTAVTAVLCFYVNSIFLVVWLMASLDQGMLLLVSV